MAADPFGSERDHSSTAPYLPPAPRADLRIIFQCVLQCILVSLFPELTGGFGSPDEASRETFGCSARALPAARPLPARRPLCGVPEPRAGGRAGLWAGGAGPEPLIGGDRAGRSRRRGGVGLEPALFIGQGGAERGRAGRGGASHWPGRRGAEPRQGEAGRGWRRHHSLAEARPAASPSPLGGLCF